MDDEWSFELRTLITIGSRFAEPRTPNKDTSRRNNIVLWQLHILCSRRMSPKRRLDSESIRFRNRIDTVSTLSFLAQRARILINFARIRELEGKGSLVTLSPKGRYDSC